MQAVAAEIARAEIKLEILPAAAKLALARVAKFLNMPRVHEKAVPWASLIFIGSADDVHLRLGHTQLASELAAAAFEEPLLSPPPPETSDEDMTVPELKSELVALGASDVGKKAELQCRLREARSSSKEAGGGEDLETALGGPEGVDAVFALLDAATLRMLKTVSASCLFEVRRVLSDAASRDLGAAATPLARRPLAMSHRTGAPLERGRGGGSKVFAVCHLTLAASAGARSTPCTEPLEQRAAHNFYFDIPTPPRRQRAQLRGGHM